MKSRVQLMCYSHLGTFLGYGTDLAAAKSALSAYGTNMQGKGKECLVAIRVFLHAAALCPGV